MKKNLQKIPKLLLAKLDNIDSNEIIVATTISIFEEEIHFQKYPGLGIEFINDQLHFNSLKLPDRGTGKYCTRNLDGKESTDKSNGKVPKTINLGERPIYGDWTRGSYDLIVTRMVWPKKIEAPKNYKLGISLLSEEVINSQRLFTFKVFINQKLNKNSGSFSEDLLYQLNILQENTGKADIFSADSSDKEFLMVKTIDWEIFPPGNRDVDINRILSKLRNVTKQQEDEISEKYDLLASMRPIEFLVGVYGPKGYFGAKFSDNLVVFENLSYGNAIYVLYENWQELSKLSRTEIVNRPKNEFDRIPHNLGWKKKLRKLVKEKLA